MSQQHSLAIIINDQCAIDAGSWQECVEEGQTPYRLVSPPQTTMYRQVLSYLEETTRNEKAPPKSQLHFGEVAIATFALCIRWGSYFAVLTNHDLPQWPAAFDPEVSCIGDGEMARINIEASAALSDWLDLMWADQPRFRKLVKAAVQLLTLTRFGGSAATSVLWIQPLFVYISGEDFLQSIANNSRMITLTHAPIFFPRF